MDPQAVECSEAGGLKWIGQRRSWSSETEALDFEGVTEMDWLEAHHASSPITYTCKGCRVMRTYKGVTNNVTVRPAVHSL
jgi:hypothetical protein